MGKPFNREAHFDVKIISGEEKVATLRFPTDQELCDRARKLKLVRRNLGRGKTQSEAGNGVELSADLFARIRVDKDGPVFDDSDAAAFIGRLDRCEVSDVEREGNQFRVTMKVPGTTVEHVLKMPTQKDLIDFGRNSMTAIDDRRQSEIRLKLEPSGDLWGRMVVSVEGYEGEGHGAVPITHKDAALNEVIAQVQRLEEDDDPNF